LTKLINYTNNNKSIEESDGITTISEYMRKRTVDVFGVSNPIDVISNFVNLKMYKPDPAARPRVPRLMHISNFRPVKRVLDCIRILALVRKEVEAELLMVGDGPLRGPAEDLTRDLGLEHCVNFIGKQDHVERLFPSAHILLMPSELEAFGLAALEGMACALVPVATRAGGVPELIEDGVTGFLEPVGDVEAQARRVVQLLSDASQYETMSSSARRAAETRFSTELVIPHYESVYERVLASNP
jgi:N-acetyl-alpha-D-glucosaminyl L-malate synthase BshA